MRIILVIVFYIIVGFSMESYGAKGNNQVTLSSVNQVKELFFNPPVEYRSAPLWVWNDKVTKSQIEQQLEDFKSVGIGGVFIHPRPGLITSYLSEDWFSLCSYTVEKGKKLGMKVWIYDENSYPSGFAGGHVPAEMPESYNLGQGLELFQFEKIPENSADYYLVLKKENSKFIDITNSLDSYKENRGEFFLYKKTYYGNSPWHGGYSYVDLLVEGVTEKFIEVTMRGYEQKFKDEFGKTVPGIFTDEPNISPPGGIRWTPSLFDEFKKRWDYDLKNNLPSITYEIGEWKRIRHNYYSTLLEMFIERWSLPWYKYCEENNLMWTGHYWEHGWPNPQHGSDNMAMYAWHQMPGIDVLMNQFSENVNAQFGNVRAVKELSSVANQFGRSRTLSETYGAGGWELSFEDMKRIGDWEYVLGVNFLNQHLSYMTIEGARKKDHPLSFSYHAPWWNQYKILGDYFARLSLALSSGKQYNPILVIEPTTTGWLYFSPHESNDKYSELGPNFQNFLVELEKNQFEYDLASENILKIQGRIKDNYFTVGERDYNKVILPPGYENMDNITYSLLETFLQNGGTVISFSGIPEYIDGSKSKLPESLYQKYTDQWIQTNSLKDPELNDNIIHKDINFFEPNNIKGNLFHHRRQFNDGQILFLVNTSSDEWSEGALKIKGKVCNELDLLSGELKQYPFKVEKGMVEISFDLPPVGSILLVITNQLSENVNKDFENNINILKAVDEVVIKNQMPNVLTIDYCDINLDNKIEKDLYYFGAADKIFKFYGFDGNPWSRAVQFKESIVGQKIINKEKGFEAYYHFNIDEGTDLNLLQAVIEHPELWSFKINDSKISEVQNEYWLDRKFGIFNIGKYVKTGHNTITLIAEKMTVHSELEPIYIKGNFNLESQDNGWKLTKMKSLQLGGWRESGLPFYSDVVSYAKSYYINPEDKRLVVKLPSWNGSVAEILVNEKKAGIVAWPPYELDITDQIVLGKNEISVHVYGTLKNLLGPHHIGPVRGTAWPASFSSAPKGIPSGNEYDFIDYGLFEDFMLIESDGPPQRVYQKIEYLQSPQIVNKDSIVFSSPLTITIFPNTNGEIIYYTLDGSDPNESSDIYKCPILLNNSSELRVKAFKPGAIPSKTTHRNFYILDNNKNGIEYKYYEGNWQELPDFEALTKINAGHVFDFNLDGIERRSSNFGVEYKTMIKIDDDGEHNFFTNSNDGSRLLIGDQLVVNNDGTHGSFERQGKINLKKGLYSMIVQYFDAGGSQSLKVYYKTPKGTKVPIPLDKLFFPNN